MLDRQTQYRYDQTLRPVISPQLPKWLVVSSPGSDPSVPNVFLLVNSTSRKPGKTDDAKAILDTANKQLRAEEADAFRGLHLDPNIHHWDEVCLYLL